MNVARPSRFYRPRPLSSLPTNGIIVPRGPTNGWEWLAWGKCMEMYSRVKLFPRLRIRCQRCRVNIERKFSEKFAPNFFVSRFSLSIYLFREGNFSSSKPLNLPEKYPRAEIASRKLRSRHQDCDCRRHIGKKKVLYLHACEKTLNCHHPGFPFPK